MVISGYCSGIDGCYEFGSSSSFVARTGEALRYCSIDYNIFLCYEASEIFCALILFRI
jgi:hypothetical protein